MVKSAYSSGIPAIGVGPGNTPALIDKSADVRMAVSSILMSKTFDNGVVCASEQAVVCHQDLYEEVKAEFVTRGAHILSKDEAQLLGAIIIDPKRGSVDPAIVGQSAEKIAQYAGFTVPASTKVLIAEVDRIEDDEPFAHEKLSPVLALYRCASFDEGAKMAASLVALGGYGHTSVLYVDEKRRRGRHLQRPGQDSRVLVNMPASQGAIGDICNFRLEPSLTLGCGWGPPPSARTSDPSTF